MMDSSSLNTTNLALDSTLTKAPLSPLTLDPMRAKSASLTTQSAALLSTADATPSTGTGLTGEYFDNADLTNSRLTRTDSTVNFNWGTGSPDSRIGVDTFSARWTGQVQARYNETYTFYTNSDDGVRLWVNGQQIINNWTDHGQMEDRGTIALEAGKKYDIKLEYYENTGGTIMNLGWSSATQKREIIPQSQLYAVLGAPPPNPGTGTGLTGEYFDNADLTNSRLTRTDSTVNFNWGTGSPDSRIGVDTFSARWTGQVQARYNETYTFYTNSDDGVRLWVNGQQIINNWTNHSPTENRGTIALEAGKKYDIKLEYYENTGGTIMNLGWSSATQSREIIPQSQLYTATSGGSTTPTINGDADNNSLSGLAGSEILQGFGGNDILISSTGNDTLDGGDGNDTANYSNATSGVIANLATGVANRIAKIMPLGDSITLGVTEFYNPNAPNNVGYRGVLWNDFQRDNIAIDFVGTYHDGSFGDNDHQGNAGTRIDQVSAVINTPLSTQKPDVVLLMLGTNDTNTSDTPAVMASELSTLIDKITASSPDLTVLVSSIPRIRSDAKFPDSSLPGTVLAQKAVDYNNLIPGVVASKGSRVKFVDTRSLLTVDDTSAPPTDMGLHPTLAGYDKIGEAWYKALLNEIGLSQGTFNVDRDTLISIENLAGSSFNDTLIGDDANNILDGNAGDDRLVGGGGSDTLTGGSGKNTFAYSKQSDFGDIITDFNSDDNLEFSATGFGLSASAWASKVLLNGTAATSNNVTFLYNNGVLQFDADGNGSGAAIAVANLIGTPTLTLSQFQLA